MEQAPAHAVQVWMDGQNIKICFNDDGKTHCVTLDSGRTGTPSEADAWALVEQIKRDDRDPSSKPMSLVRGWAAFRNILRDRAQSARTPAMIGQTRSITQDQLDKMVKAFGGEVQVVGRKRTVENVTLGDLGL